jgi:hypothetical protein
VQALSPGGGSGAIGGSEAVGGRAESRAEIESGVLVSVFASVCEVVSVSASCVCCAALWCAGACGNVW